MNVSVIIPTRNRPDTLEETILFVVNKQKYPLDKIEIIVINDGDAPLDSLEQRYQNLVIIKNSGKGAASARNTGAKHAKNELLIFMDDDILMGEDCIIKHIEMHQKFPHSLVSAWWEYSKNMLAMHKNSPFGRFKIKTEFKWDEKDSELIQPGIYECTGLGSFNLSVLKDNFIASGGFNADFPFAGVEDQEFALRLRAKGFRLLLDTLNVTIHNEKDRIVMKRWMMRQYTGIQGYVLMCELAPLKKKERLYYENTYIRKYDTGRLKLKKVFKYWLSRDISLAALSFTTRIFEGLHMSDLILFKFYNVICGLYIYKGFRHSEKYNLAQFKAQSAKKTMAASLV